MPKIIHEEGERRKGLTFTMKQDDIDRLDEYRHWMEEQADAHGVHIPVSRQLLLERLVLDYLNMFDKYKEREKPQG